MVRFIGKEVPELSREKAMLECHGSLGLELCFGDDRTCTLQNRPDYAVRDCTMGGEIGEELGSCTGQDAQKVDSNQLCNLERDDDVMYDGSI